MVEPWCVSATAKKLILTSWFVTLVSPELPPDYVFQGLVVWIDGIEMMAANWYPWRNLFLQSLACVILNGWTSTTLNIVHITCLDRKSVV